MDKNPLIAKDFYRFRFFLLANFSRKDHKVFQIFLKRDTCLILLLSIATHLSKNLLLACNQFSFLDEQMNRCIFRYKSMKWVNRDKSINETSVSSISFD